MYAKKKKRKYKIKNMLLFLLLIFLLLKGLSCTFNNKQEEKKSEQIKKNVEKQINYLNKMEYDTSFDGSIDKESKDIIIEYMNKYFKSITELKNIDMTYLYDENSYEEAYLNQSAISMLVECRKLNKNNMKIDEAKYDIIVKKIEKNNGKIIINFLENDYFNFHFMNGIKSKAKEIENTIILKKEGTKYKIISFRKTQDFYVMFTNEYKIGNSNKKAKINLDKLKEDYIYDYKEHLENMNLMFNRYKNNKDKITKKCDHNYNREKALKYAKSNVFEKSKDWMNYSEVGGNCQNFASQVIYTGGIPMDITGDMIWKHYDSELDSTNKKIGRSSSWTTVPYFYEYAKNNKGYGLCAETDINFYYALPGDIGQVGYNDEYRHSVVIIGKIKDKNNKMLDLLINSNSLNLENYPLSGYVYPNKRIIKITGWNEK